MQPLQFELFLALFLFPFCVDLLNLAYQGLHVFSESINLILLLSHLQV